MFMDKFWDWNEICLKDLETWAMSYLEAKGGQEWPFGFLDYRNWKKWCTRKYLVFIPPKNLWPIKFAWNMSGMFVWSTRWKQLDLIVFVALIGILFVYYLSWCLKMLQNNLIFFCRTLGSSSNFTHSSW